MASALHVSCDFAEAMLVVGGNDSLALAAARDLIDTVDPPSRGVPMRQVCTAAYVSRTIVNIVSVHIDQHGAPAARPIARMSDSTGLFLAGAACELAI